MPALHLSAFGSPAIRIDGTDITVSLRKAMALLVYLVVTGRSHSRDALATLFWPDLDQTKARAGLRRTLSALQKAIGPQWLEVDQETVGPQPGAEMSSDVHEFLSAVQSVRGRSGDGKAIDQEEAEALERAVGLYQDDFLAGFSLPDAPDFDEWQFFTGEDLRRQLTQVLQRLTNHFADTPYLDKAIEDARRWLRFDPTQEEAHRHLMRLYARDSQRSAALRQYRECLRILAEEYGTQPEPQTTALYERIKREGAGGLEPVGEETGEPTPQMGPETSAGTSITPSQVSSRQAGQDRPTCVAREAELDRLSALLQGVVGGQGQVVLITGEAGSGKSTLLKEFTFRVRQAEPAILTASGHCDSLTGMGDPYLPFRQMMAQLVAASSPATEGPHPSRRGRGAATAEQPAIRQALSSAWPELADVLVPSFVATVVGSDGLALGADLARGSFGIPSTARHDAPAQTALFEQFTGFLGWLSDRSPLVLAIDDGQWIDEASVGLLFSLCRILAGHRILLLLAYRPAEVSLGRDGRRHQLEPLVNEVRRLFGEVRIDLDEAAGRDFVDAFLDSHPNVFSRRFRDSLFARTQGHPLFTVELLRDLRGRGDILLDDAGRWTDGPAIEWNRLPGRVEAVIEERVRRLEPDLRQTLAYASVQGETFLAELVAKQRDIDSRLLFQQMTVLDKVHNLLREDGQVTTRDQVLTRFRFAHTLFQQYLYNTVGAGERRLLHRDLAAALEDAFRPDLQEISYELSQHWLDAGEGLRAADHLLVAGDRARNLYAHAEAVDLYSRALKLFLEHGGIEQAARTCIKLGLAHHQEFDFEKSRKAYAEGFRLRRQFGARQPSVLAPATRPLRLVSEEPPTLDPALCHDETSAAIIAQMFCGLATITPELDVVPELAESWEILENGGKYVFHLRPDNRWSDGQALTSADVLYAWRRVLDPGTGSPEVAMLFDIKGARAFHESGAGDASQLGISAPDALTIVVELEKPVSYFPHIVTQQATFAVPQHVVERMGAAWLTPASIVTSGAFRLTSWKPGQELCFARNNLYGGRVSGNVTEVCLTTKSAGWTRRIELYERDMIDMLDLGWLPRQLDVFHRHAAERSFSPPLNVQYVGFDVHSAPFSDRRVRQAFAHAIDRKALVDTMLAGQLSPARGGLVPPGMPGHSPEIGLPYDPEHARALLAEAGYPDAHGFPEVRALRGGGFDAVGEFLTQQWHDVLAVDIHWQIIEWGDFLSCLLHDPPQLFVLGWIADYPDPDNLLRFVVSSPWVDWKDERYWSLIEAARRTTDQCRRIRYYQLADALLAQDVPMFPLLYGRHHRLLKPWITDRQRSPVHWASWKDIIIRPHGKATD